MLRSLSLALTSLTVSASGALAQVGPAVRQIGPVVAKSTEEFGPVVTLRHTAQGVLVNDAGNRRLLMFDPQLAASTVIADSTPATGNSYASRMAGLIAYRGDSTLFVEPMSMSMLVLAPDGKVARVMALPRTRDAMVLGNTQIGAPGFDAKGRLVYRAMPQMQFRAMGGGPGGGMPQPPEQPDTAPIVRVDLESRVTDTIGYLKVPRPKMEMNRDESTGRFTMNITMNPLPTVDDFAVLSDGSVALVRGRDYHVDFVRSDDTKESAGKMPFDWQRLTDEDKVAFIDSLKAARERFLAANPQPDQPAASGSTTTTQGPRGETRQETRVVMGGAQGPLGGGGNPLAGMMNNRNVNFVSPQELPDYKPPFFAGSSRPDLNGNVWIRTIPTKGTAGGPIYDVINAKGELVERVQVPKDRAVIGFGQDVVYLSVIDGAKQKIEKVKLR